jgi:hypothetical protein
MREKTFLFDHEGFRREAKPFIQQADEGNYKAILQRARSIPSRISPQEWILEGQGTSLAELDASPGPWRTGAAFLVLLSEFLRPNPFARSIGSTGLIVSHFGWSERDIKLLSEGMATTSLIKPEQIPDPLQRPPAGDRRWYDPAYYWWWVRPANAYSTGWLAYEQILEFHKRLLSIRPEYLQLDVSTLDLPSSPVITQKDLVEDYYRTIELFEMTIKAEEGFFYILA